MERGAYRTRAILRRDSEVPEQRGRHQESRQPDPGPARRRTCSRARSRTRAAASGSRARRSRRCSRAGRAARSSRPAARGGRRRRAPRARRRAAPRAPSARRSSSPRRSSVRGATPSPCERDQHPLDRERGTPGTPVSAGEAEAVGGACADARERERDRRGKGRQHEGEEVRRPRGEVRDPAARRRAAPRSASHAAQTQNGVGSVARPRTPTPRPRRTTVARNTASVHVHPGAGELHERLHRDVRVLREREAAARCRRRPSRCRRRGRRAGRSGSRRPSRPAAGAALQASSRRWMPPGSGLGAAASRPTMHADAKKRSSPHARSVSSAFAMAVAREDPEPRAARLERLEQRDRTGGGARPAREPELDLVEPLEEPRASRSGMRASSSRIGSPGGMPSSARIASKSCTATVSVPSMSKIQCARFARFTASAQSAASAASSSNARSRSARRSARSGRRSRRRSGPRRASPRS